MDNIASLGGLLPKRAEIIVVCEIVLPVCKKMVAAPLVFTISVLMVSRNLRHVTLRSCITNLFQYITLPINFVSLGCIFSMLP